MLFRYFWIKMSKLFANSGDSDQKSQNVLSDLAALFASYQLDVIITVDL